MIKFLHSNTGLNAVSINGYVPNKFFLHFICKAKGGKIDNTLYKHSFLLMKVELVIPFLSFVIFFAIPQTEKLSGFWLACLLGEEKELVCLSLVFFCISAFPVLL